MGTPIRLVRNDGGIIELMATTLSMNVDRGVTPHTMPLTGGSRFAFDLNLPKSLITIEGVMTDDDLINLNTQQEASALIDFSRGQGQSADSTVRWNAYAHNLVSGMTTDVISEADYAIKINNTYEVWIAKSTSNYGLSGGRYYFAVHDGTSLLTANQMATNFAALINNYAGTFNMNAEVINSPIDGETNVSVTLTQVQLGKSGNIPHPSFSTWPKGQGVYKPLYTLFSGGADSPNIRNKSAGDKVAELFGVLNNSNNGGGGTLASGLLGGIIAGQTLPATTGNVIVDTKIGLNLKYGDYIIGIQIPFSSNINNRESLFYMPTGGTMDILDKTADNALPTGSTFKPYDSEYTGIKGTVANATFVQLGGEPIYSYTINFAPIDWIF
jgi:hypothetical protein